MDWAHLMWTVTGIVLAIVVVPVWVFMLAKAIGYGYSLGKFNFLQDYGLLSTKRESEHGDKP